MLSHNGRKHVLFQSTLPRGERLNSWWPEIIPHRFQSTLPRGERPSSISQFTNLIQISIHAPTRGATLFSESYIIPTFISIHAPTRGATVLIMLLFVGNKISIHAPTRGATQNTTRTMGTILFQSTLPRGERPFSIICMAFL